VSERAPIALKLASGLRLRKRLSAAVLSELMEKLMKARNVSSEHRSCFLVGGPSWGDAEFYGKWLLAASQAERFWREAQQDLKFLKRVERVTLVYIPDFGLTASLMIMQLKEYRTSLIIDRNSEEAEDFAMMAAMGFFRDFDRRYQMIVPTRLEPMHVIIDLNSEEAEDFAMISCRNTNDEERHPISRVYAAAKSAHI
jgi:hypothetical protein